MIQKFKCYIAVISIITVCCARASTHDKLMNYMLANMTDEEKVGQLFMIGFEGTEVPPRLRSWIEDRYLGGVIIFRKNIQTETQLMELTADIQAIADSPRYDLPSFPLLIATDQELGKRSTTIHFAGIPPGAKEVAQMDSSQVQGLAQHISSNLKDWGVNMALAPVVDVDRPEGGIPLSYRTLSSDPGEVARLSGIIVTTYQNEGIIPAAKHFPGLGDVDVDSHRDTPQTDKTLDELYARELIPYQALIEKDVACIMSAHILVPSLDSIYPATLSHNILTGLLRDSLGFEGVIITDAMQMGGISKHYRVDEACVMAINAGSDIILHCQFKKGLATAEDCYMRVLQAVESGEISAERLDQAVRRVLELKVRYL